MNNPQQKFYYSIKLRKWLCSNCQVPIEKDVRGTMICPVCFEGIIDLIAGPEVSVKKKDSVTIQKPTYHDMP